MLHKFLNWVLQRLFEGGLECLSSATLELLHVFLIYHFLAAEPFHLLGLPEEAISCWENGAYGV